jgi:hypothetical protein
MRTSLLSLIFFVLYCAEAGLFFLLAPWNPGWERLAYELPFTLLRELMLAPALRGAVTGFGLVHLVWAVHDLRLLVSGRWRRAAGLAEPPLDTEPGPEPAGGG